jgi:hypothetical protein
MDQLKLPAARKLHLPGALLLTAGLLAGCSSASGGSADPAASVASIPTTAAPPATARATPSPAAVAGPLIRADTTSAEIFRLQAAWGACLKNHGVPGITKETSAKLDVEGITRKYPKAITACASRRPELVTERFEREHPEEVQAHLRKFIKCMKDDGQKIVFIPPDGWGVSDEAAASGYTPSARSHAKCESEVYGD